MANPRRIFLAGWTFLSVLAGFGLGTLFLQSAVPASADELLNGGSSEGSIESASADVFVPDAFLHHDAAAAALATQTLYYFPLDSNNHNTLLFFHNTSTITATIDLDFQNDNGGACLSGVVFDIPPGDSARVSADSLEAGSPSSWSDTVIYNMFDTCEIGLITMPDRGVRVAGYVAWTPTDIYNPREQNPHSSIRFSADPYSIFLPNLDTVP